VCLDTACPVNAVSAQTAGGGAPAPGSTTVFEETYSSSSTTTRQPSIGIGDFGGAAATRQQQQPVVIERSTTTSQPVQLGPLTIKKVFLPLYKQRLSDYAEQLQLGISRGWLNNDQAAHFSSELERLRQLEVSCASQQYARSCVDELDRQFTQFNIQFSNALQQVVPPAKTSGATGTGATTSATTAGDTTPGATTSGTTPGANTSATTPGATMPGATTPSATTPDAITPRGGQPAKQ
jgi:hypothetical protein